MSFIVILLYVSLIFILGYRLSSVPRGLINIVKEAIPWDYCIYIVSFFSLNVAVTFEIYFKIYKVLGYFSCLQMWTNTNTFRDPGYYEKWGEFKYKLVSWTHEDNPIKANLSTLLVRHRTGHLLASQNQRLSSKLLTPPTNSSLHREARCF